MPALNCIYIDFEGRIDQDPVLLGELHHDDGSERFTQWVIDPQLSSAAVAQRHLQVLPLSAVAAQLATTLAAQDTAAVVAWSNHEASILETIAGLGRRHRDLIQKRYVNAIPTAKAWRRALLPRWAPAAEELKLYFDATGFKPRLASQVSRQPAAWIEHTQRRVIATGSYHQVGSTVKRDWQNLLIYNEDDCRGLQHVHSVTSRELGLWKAYMATTFEIDGRRGPVHVRIGQRGRRLRRLLEDQGASTWAFISAWNPASELLSDNENAARHRALITAVGGRPCLSGRGIPQHEGWTPEESLFIPNISEGKAVALGRKFGQLAVVFGRREEPAQLLSCRVLPESRL